MVYIGFIVCVAICTVIGYCIGKHKRRYPRNKVFIDLETFEYLKDRDDELWEIERSARKDIDKEAVVFSIRHKILTTPPTDILAS